MASRKAGVVTINLSSGTAQFITDMDRAKAKVRDFGSAGARGFREFGAAGVSETAATRAGLKALEGQFFNNKRAADKFLESIAGAGPLLQKAFPVLGAVAFAGVLVETAEKAYEFFKSIGEAPEKIAAAFRGLNAPLQTTNDELRVANDRLENDIAKLEGKRENNLALALDETRVVADKLADSLDKDLENLNKVFKEEGIGKLNAFFTGRASTSEQSEELKEFTARLARIDAEGNAAVRAAKTKQEAAAAQDGWNKKALEALDEQIKKTGQLVEHQRMLERIREGRATPEDRQAYFQEFPGRQGGLVPISSQVPDQRPALRATEGELSNLNFVRDRYALSTTNATLTGKKDELTAAAANAALGRPFEERMKALTAQLEGIQAKMAAIGQGAAAETVAKSFAEAQKAIEEVNRALERQHTKLTAAQEASLRDLESKIANAEAESQWKTKLDATTDSIDNRITSQRALTDAIGRGYEATKRASVETSVIGALGRDYSDADFMKAHQADVEGLRTKFGEQYDANHAEQVQTAIQGLNQQIDLERSLAKAQTDGAEAVRQATLAWKSKQIEMTHDAETAKKLIAAEVELYNAQRGNVSAENVAKIDEQTKALERLTAAVWRGAEAARKAGLESKYSELQRAGASPEEIAASRRQDEAGHQNEISTEAARLANSYGDALDRISQISEKLKEAKATQGDTLGIEIALRNLENERLRLLAEQTLQGRSARDGVRAFFIDMQRDAKSAADSIYEALHSALDRVSDEIGKLATGQKTSFGKVFQDIGQQLVKDEAKSYLQKGLGAVGRLFGIPGLGQGKPDGTRGNPLWVQMATPSFGGGGDITFGGFSFPTGGAGGGNGSGGLFGGGSQGGVVYSYGGARAAGGDVSADSAYLVGENGPEVLMGASGRVASNSESRRMLSGSSPAATYFIDARGTDPVIVEQRVRTAIIAAHGSAISGGVRAMDQRMKRTPQR